MIKVMVLGASVLQLPAIIEAKRMGYQVIAVDMNECAVGLRYANLHEIISTIDVESVLKAAMKHKINGIITLASDMPMRTVAKVAKELNLIGISEETAYKATNKYAMRKALKEYGVPIPEFYKAINKTEYIEALNKLKGAVIVKPADNSGSRGVYLLKVGFDASEAEGAFERAKKFSRNGEIVIERYMEGKEISVETFSVSGRCHVIQITDKITTGAPYFVEMGHTQPSIFCFDETIKEKITDIAKGATHAVGIDNGPAHVEIMVTKDGPKVVELGARLGGDYITTELVPLSTGINMVEKTIQSACGIQVDLKKHCCKGAAIRYFETKKGFLKKVEGINAAKSMVGVKKVELFLKEGDKVGPICSSSDRVGCVICEADTAVEAIKRCEAVLDVVKFDIN